MQRAEKWILPKVRYLTAKEIKKMERDAGKDYRRGYLTQGVFTREAFILVLEYLEQIPKIPRQEDVFYEGLADFLLEDWTSEEKETLYILARKTVEYGCEYLAESDLKEYCGVSTKTVEEYVERGIILQNGKWYHFWNFAFRISLALRSIESMSSEEKREYYQK